MKAVFGLTASKRSNFKTVLVDKLLLSTRILSKSKLLDIFEETGKHEHGGQSQDVHEEINTAINKPSRLD